MTKATFTLVQLPFQGFYESTLSNAIDWEIERQAENDAESSSYEADSEHKEGYWPEALRLDESELCEALNDCADYSAIHQDIAKDYAIAFGDWIKDETDADPRISFESMSSPKFYNFETDRLFAHISRGFVRTMWRDLKADSWTNLAKSVKARHTSYSGFHSFYSNCMPDWTGKDPRELDHNELQTVLLAWLALKELDVESFVRDFEESVSENSYTYADAGIDWKAYEAKRAEARFSKLAKLDAEALGDCLASHNGRIRALAESHPGEFLEALSDCVAEMEAPDLELDRIAKALDSWLPGLMRSNPSLAVPVDVLDALERYDLVAPCPATLNLFEGVQL
jgi:hypothetical protein